jgi:hypothetical protein
MPWMRVKRTTAVAALAVSLWLTLSMAELASAQGTAWNGAPGPSEPIAKDDDGGRKGRNTREDDGGSKDKKRFLR